MFKNQLQELAQRSCFNLPAYACTREGPDHAPRFRATVNFNGEIFQSLGYSPTLRQAEHSAAEVALNLLSSTASKSLTARVLDETGVYKNLLQETAHKAGLNLPVYTTIRRGPGHVPVFTCTVELAGMIFTGDSAKTKKQAEKNAAISAWSSLKKMPSLVSDYPHKYDNKDEQEEEDEEEEMIVRRVLSNFKPQKPGKQKDHHHRHNNHLRRSRNTSHWRSDYPHKYDNNNKPWKQPSEIPFPNRIPGDSRNLLQPNIFVDLLPPPPPRTTSKILPLTSKNHNITLNEEGQNGNNFGDSNNTIQDFLLHTPRTTPNNTFTFKEEGQNGNLGDSNKTLQDFLPPSPITTSKLLHLPSRNNTFTLKEEGRNGNLVHPMANKPNNALEELGQSYFRNLFFGPVSCGQRGNMVNYHDNLKGVAPAVQIRSIVPVCATPPPIKLISEINNVPNFTAQINSDLSKLGLP